jgi:hypothetical protein
MQDAEDDATQSIEDVEGDAFQSIQEVEGDAPQSSLHYCGQFSIFMFLNIALYETLGIIYIKIERRLKRAESFIVI